MSLFGDLDIASAEEDIFSVPDGSYSGYISKVEAGPTKSGDKMGLSIYYQISEGNHASKPPVREWKEIPTFGKDNYETAKSYLKIRLMSLGIPESKMNTLDADDLVGIKVVFRTKIDERGFVQVKFVEVLED